MAFQGKSRFFVLTVVIDEMLGVSEVLIFKGLLSNFSEALQKP